MLANRVREFTTTVGTGDITLGGAFAGHVRFADAFTTGNANGVKFFAKANLRNADGNTTTVSLDIRRTDGSNNYSIGVLLTPVTPNTRIYPINTRVPQYSGTRTYELTLRWWGYPKHSIQRCAA